MLAQGVVSKTAGEDPLVDIVRRVAKGDQAALGQLYDVTSAAVYGLVRRMLGDASAAEEITIDVYSQVWRLAPGYSEEKGSPTTWLLVLARSRALDHLRSVTRRIREREHPIEFVAELSHPGPNPEMTVISENRRQIIQAVLADLPPEQLELIQMAFFEGLTHNEVAERTGIPLGTIKSRIRAGMTRMRELLERRLGAL
jgi:RNA polymerase sigma-70 factor, ECF subfamily